MRTMASQITGVSIVYSTVCSGADQSKLRATGLSEGTSPVTGQFPEQKTSNGKMRPLGDVILYMLYWDTNSWYIQCCGYG